MDSSSQFLFLASGIQNDEGFWLVGVKNSDEKILADKKLLDCHRKELIGKESAKDIIYAINLNLNNLLIDLEKNNYLINKPSFGISFDIPLDFLESIFDFWFDLYSNKNGWETCIGLLKIRQKYSLSNLIKSGSLKGNSRKWALKVETLHSFKPNSSKNRPINEPMWK